MCVSGIKPGVDAMRVAQGSERDPKVILDPVVELSFTKAVEMFTEAIP